MPAKGSMNSSGRHRGGRRKVPGRGPGGRPGRLSQLSGGHPLRGEVARPSMYTGFRMSDHKTAQPRRCSQVRRIHLILRPMWRKLKAWRTDGEQDRLWLGLFARRLDAHDLAGILEMPLWEDLRTDIASWEGAPLTSIDPDRLVIDSFELAARRARLEERKLLRVTMEKPNYFTSSMLSEGRAREPCTRLTKWGRRLAASPEGVQLLTLAAALAWNDVARVSKRPIQVAAGVLAVSKFIVGWEAVHAVATAVIAAIAVGVASALHGG